MTSVFPPNGPTASQQDDPKLYILLVPDSFKGSLDSAGVAAALTRGIRRAAPNARITSLPVADGGEGTVNALITAAGGTRHTLEVTGPEHSPVPAEYGLLADGAIIELASAAGLPRTQNPNPETSTTYGVGELIRHLAEHRLTIGAGGSATHDLGRSEE